MDPLHVATLTELRLYLASRVSTLPLYKYEAMAPLHVATLTVERELSNYMRLYLASKGLYPTSVSRMKPWLHFMWPH